MSPHPQTINLELAKLLGIDDLGNVQSIDVVIEPGTYPKVTVHRFVHRGLGQAGTVLRSRSFDLVPRGDAKPGASQSAMGAGIGPFLDPNKKVLGSKLPDPQAGDWAPIIWTPPLPDA